LSKDDIARIAGGVGKRPALAPYNGFGKRTPSQRPPVLTPAELARGNGNGQVHGEPSPVGDVGAPAPGW
jgi:cell division protease FtsH